MATKATKNEIEQRVSQVYKLLIVGTSRPAILQYASKSWGKISDRAVDTYISKARKAMLCELLEDRRLALAEEIELRRMIIQEALTDKKYQVALQSADSRAKLLGLFIDLDRAIEIVIAAGFEVSEPL